MKKYLALSAILGTLILVGFGCAKPVIVEVKKIPEQTVTNPTTLITYFISPNGPDDKTKYCNGADMDSAGYKLTLTKEVTTTVDGTLTGKALINKTLNLAAQAAGFSLNLAENEDYVKVASGTAYLKPVEGWAGVSIYLCNWQPFVEKNLEQFSEIKKIEWSVSPEDFNKIK